MGQAMGWFAGYPDAVDGWNRYLVHLRAVLLEDAVGTKFEAEWIAAEKARSLPLVGLVQNPDRPLAAPEGDYSHLDSAHSEAVFQRLLAKEGKVEADLGLVHGLAPWKLRVGRAMILETTVTFAWLAKRLKSGSSTHLSAVLSEPWGQTTLR